jgi:hypothetical protein
VLLQLLPFLPEPQQSLLDYIKELFDTDGATPTAWVKAQIVWEHVGNTNAADRYVNSFDVVNITGGEIDSSWTSTDLNDLTVGLNAMLTTMLSLYPSDMKCLEYRYYLRYFAPITPVADRGPDWKDEPYGPSGPPLQVVPKNAVGTATGVSLPPQVSLAHTEKTAYPRHWGRSYWPGISSTYLDTHGIWGSSGVNAVADAVKAGFDALATDELYPMVPVTQVDKQPFRGLLGITQLQVDNVPDIQRRRRASVTTQRVVRP